MSTSKAEELVPIPGPPALPILGNLFSLDLANIVQSIRNLAKKYGPIYQITFVGTKHTVISNRDLMNELCDEKRFCKIIAGPLTQLRDGVGDGLFTAHDGEANWGKAHRICTPIFGPIKIRNMFDGMKDITSQLCLKWARYGPSHSIDVTDDIVRLTLDTIALCTMNFRINSFYRDDNLHPFIKSLNGFMEEAELRSALPRFSTYIRRSASRAYQHNIAFMKEVSQGILDERRKNPVSTPDLLNALLLQKDPQTGLGLSDDVIINNLITFLSAGHETTSGMISFTLLYLLKHPETYAKAREEIDTVIGRESIRVEHLSQLPYIAAAMKESLRLMPTVPAFSVMPREDCVVGGKYKVEKGQPLHILLDNVHRDPTVWGEDAEDWKPERMLDVSFSSMKPNSWKPFGNGSRGCIGRAFAWQEAQLLLATIIQTFDIILEDPAYELKIKESLSKKPDGFRIRASVRDQGNLATLLHGSSAPSRTSEPSSVNSKLVERPMTILYGSNSGTCEALANRLSSHAHQYGFGPSRVVSMDSMTDNLPSAQPLVIITASYDGEPTNNAKQFVTWLKSSNENSLEKCTYAVFGCGNRDWTTTFHKIPTLVDELLANKGATRLATLGKADVASGDIFSDFEIWEENVLWPAITTKFNPNFTHSNSQSKLQVLVSHPRAATLHQNVTAEGIVTCVQTLTKSGPVKKSIEIRLPQGSTYCTGDYLMVLPRNPQKTVQRALAAFRTAGDTVLELEAPSNSTSLPLRAPMSAADLLGSYVELNQPATLGNIAILAETAGLGEATKIALLSMKDTLASSKTRDKRPSVIDILEKFTDINLNIGDFLEMLPPLRARTYSISSSPDWNPSHASLTFSVLNAPSRAGGGQYLGVASNYLSEACVGDVIRVMTCASKASFHPPTHPDEFPVIMIAAGSGIAPFMGFIQERMLQLRAGKKLQNALLFFGCRSPDLDDLHRDKLNEFEDASAVIVHRAYSNGSFGPRYVQDKLWEHRSQVGEMWDNGAKVFVCGNVNMVDGARKVFIDILTEKGIQDCASFLAQQENSRFVVEVFA